MASLILIPSQMDVKPLLGVLDPHSTVLNTDGLDAKAIKAKIVEGTKLEQLDNIFVIDDHLKAPIHESDNYFGDLDNNPLTQEIKVSRLWGLNNTSLRQSVNRVNCVKELYPNISDKQIQILNAYYLNLNPNSRFPHLQIIKTDTGRYVYALCEIPVDSNSNTCFKISPIPRLILKEFDGSAPAVLKYGILIEKPHGVAGETVVNKSNQFISGVEVSAVDQNIHIGIDHEQNFWFVPLGNINPYGDPKVLVSIQSFLNSSVPTLYPNLIGELNSFPVYGVKVIKDVAPPPSQQILTNKKPGIANLFGVSEPKDAKKSNQSKEGADLSWDFSFSGISDILELLRGLPKGANFYVLVDTSGSMMNSKLALKRLAPNLKKLVNQLPWIARKFVDIGLAIKTKSGIKQFKMIGLSEDQIDAHIKMIEDTLFFSGREVTDEDVEEVLSYFPESEDGLYQFLVVLTDSDGIKSKDKLKDVSKGKAKVIWVNTEDNKSLTSKEFPRLDSSQWRKDLDGKMKQWKIPKEYKDEIKKIFANIFFIQNVTKASLIDKIWDSLSHSNDSKDLYSLIYPIIENPIEDEITMSMAVASVVFLPMQKAELFLPRLIAMLKEDFDDPFKEKILQVIGILAIKGSIVAVDALQTLKSTDLLFDTQGQYPYIGKINKHCKYDLINKYKYSPDKLNIKELNLCNTDYERLEVLESLIPISMAASKNIYIKEVIEIYQRSDSESVSKNKAEDLLIKSMKYDVRLQQEFCTVYSTLVEKSFCGVTYGK